MIKNFLKILLFPILGNVKSKPKIAPPAPLQSDTLFVFAASFACEPEATDYALGLNSDTSLSADLAGAGIGVDDVEIIFGEDRLAAINPMLHFIGARHPMGDANTLLLLSDRGYDPTTLNGDHIRFVGKCSVS